MRKTLSIHDFAIDGIGGRFTDNPTPDILAGIEAGSAFEGFSHLIKLIPAGDTVLVPVLVSGGMDWYAVFTGTGPVFLRVERGDPDKIAVVDNLPDAAMVGLARAMNAMVDDPEDFDVEIVLDTDG